MVFGTDRSAGIGSTHPLRGAIAISIGIWAFGILVFTLLVKIAILIQVYQLRYAPAGRRTPRHEDALRPAGGSSAP